MRKQYAEKHGVIHRIFFCVHCAFFAFTAAIIVGEIRRKIRESTFSIIRRKDTVLNEIVEQVKESGVNHSIVEGVNDTPCTSRLDLLENII